MSVTNHCFRSILFLCAGVLFGPVLPAVAHPAELSSEGGIRVHLPPSGQLRIENRFGDVSVEVWSEKDVAVAVTTGGPAFTHSPLVMETKNDLVSISIVQTAEDSPARINLTLQIPANARAEINTVAGVITSRGLSATMSLRTISGAIRADLDYPIDADIMARSTAGAVRSQLDTGGAEEHSFQSRVGTGKRVLRANSERGDIVIGVLAGSNTQSAEQPPQLRDPQRPAKSAGTPANQSQTEEVGEGDVIRVDAQLVTLNLSVVDRGTNKGVVGLTQSSFKVLENGVEQQIVHFDSSSAPFDLVLLIDLSGSTRDVVKLIRAAARRFVDAARPADRIAIITFAGKPTLVSALTLDREALRRSIDAIDTSAGDTKLYDATEFAMNEVTRETKSTRRTAIVLMSDGLDGTVPGVHGQEGSKLSYKELLNIVQEFDGVLYTLWLNTIYEALNPEDTQPEAFDTGYDRMKEMAGVGGGMFYEVERLEDLAGAYERVVADLGTVYSMAYRPTNKRRDRKWRAVRVTVDRDNAVARGKHGYYAN